MRFHEAAVFSGEYLGTLPTVHDLLRPLPVGEAMVACYDDLGQDLSGRRAYVVRPSSDKGDYEAVSLGAFLSA